MKVARAVLTTSMLQSVSAFGMQIGQTQLELGDRGLRAVHEVADNGVERGRHGRVVEGRVDDTTGGVHHVKRVGRDNDVVGDAADLGVS